MKTSNTVDIDHMCARKGGIRYGNSNKTLPRV